MAWPSVLVIASATLFESVLLSLPLAVAPEDRSVAVAVLTSGLADMLGANATGAVKTSALPAPAAMAPPVVPRVAWPAVPVTVPHSATPVAAHVADAVSVTPGGSASLSVMLSASDRPVFVTVMT